MGGVRSTYGEKCIKGVWRGNLKKEEQLEELGIERFCNIQIGLKEVGWDFVDLV